MALIGFSLKKCILKGIWFWLNTFYFVYKLSTIAVFPEPREGQEEGAK